MIDTIPRLLKLERMLWEFRMEIGKSLGWWLACSTAGLESATGELDQPFPITNLMVISFREDLIDTLGPCVDFDTEFSKDRFPTWLQMDAHIEFKGLENLINCLRGFRQQSLSPIQPALLKGFDHLLKWTLAELKPYTDNVIEATLVQNNESR